ncbi:hypothetical protein PoB_005576900 [Plakobranchus ocellatus]|uniref:Uncharacterized protein n=1 Tax=Plakobranchus ocellatus TaxID=259542 RepID=A0AAV4CEU5_9GAST|nr:hypothetical protein PoB_005576900 [Plakobranchus ocellatus]
MVTAANGHHSITRNSSFFKAVLRQEIEDPPLHDITDDDIRFETGQSDNHCDEPQSQPSQDQVLQASTKPTHVLYPAGLQVERPCSPAVDEVPSSPPPSRLQAHSQTNDHPHTVTRSGRVVIPPNKYTC